MKIKKEVFNAYVKQVCEKFGVSEEELFSKTKKRDITIARHFLIYLCYKRYMRLSKIQEFLKERGYDTKHQPIKYAIVVVRKKMRKDEDYRAIFDEINKCAIV